MSLRVICLDVGQKRTGVAVTDAINITAQGVCTIETRGVENDIKRVREICAEYDTNRVLIGLPRNMDGSEGFQAARCREFGNKLAESGCEVRYHDERLSSKAAERALIEGGVRREKRKGVIDMLAACNILRSFMDSGGWQPIIDKKSEVFVMADDRNHELDMEPENIVELVDEEGKAEKFEHLMSFEHKERVYIALAPVEPIDEDTDAMMILRIDQDEQGVDVYSVIEDDAELDEAFEEYLRIAESDEYDDTEE